MFYAKPYPHVKWNESTEMKVTLYILKQKHSTAYNASKN